jgi:hypothetical protein
MPGRSKGTQDLEKASKNNGERPLTVRQENCASAHRTKIMTHHHAHPLVYGGPLSSSPTPYPPPTHPVARHTHSGADRYRFLRTISKNQGMAQFLHIALTTSSTTALADLHSVEGRVCLPPTGHITPPNDHPPCNW